MLKKEFIMKRFFTLLTLVLLTVAWTWANPVDPDEARNFAQTFWTLKCGQRGPADFENVSASAGVSNIYIFDNQNAPGFVIVSGDDCVIPILAYSDANNFGTGEMPDNLRSWLGYYEMTIAAAVQHQSVVSEDVVNQWNNLRAGRLPVEESRDIAAVSPLLSTTWDQGAPYNNLCPGTGSNKAYVGCAATAMAQVMKYYNWPTTGTGSHSYVCNNSGYNYGTLSANFGATTYDWGNMLNNYPYQNSGTTAQRTAVATLMYHCGVSVEMEYTPEGSGAQIADFYQFYGTHNASVEYALKNFFGYSQNIHSEWLEQYSNNQWINMLKTELNNARPVLYSGYNSDNEGGHAFVCDGYDNSNNFHFNWGWSGYGDGYFAITNLTPGTGGIGGGTYDFSYVQHALFGIEPDGGGGNPDDQDFNMQMYSDFTVNPSPLQQNQSVAVSVSMANYGEGDFAGAVKLSLLTTSNVEAQVIQQGNLSTTLTSMTYMSLDLSGTVTVNPGTYKLALYYKASNESSWTLVHTDYGYTNPLTVTVAGSTPSVSFDMQMYSDFSYTPNPLRKNQTATVEVSVANYGDGDFNGAFKLSLLTSGNTEAQVIQQGTLNGTLSSMTYVPLTLSGTITVNPGTYRLALYYMGSNESSWTLVGTDNGYSNPLIVTVTGSSDITDNTLDMSVVCPNPATDYIRINGFDYSIDKVEIFNELGKIVFSQQNVVPEQDLNISHLDSGVYFIRYATRDGIRTQKFIKR